MNGLLLRSSPVPAAGTGSMPLAALDEKLLQSLRDDNVDDSVVRDELTSLEAREGEVHTSAARRRLTSFLHSNPVEITLVVLVISDVIILLAMLVIDLNVLHLQLEEALEIKQNVALLLKENCQGNEPLLGYEGTSLKEISALLHKDGCYWIPDANLSSSIDNSVPVRHSRAAGQGSTYDNHIIQLLQQIAHYLHFVSIAILALMVLEVILKIYGQGCKYFKGKLEVVDGVVIVISFGMDLYFAEGVFASGISNVATILVILLLWRILRVFNALLVTAKRRLQFRIRVQKRMRKTLYDKVSQLDGEIQTLRGHISNLEKVAKLHHIPEYEIAACKPFVPHAAKLNAATGIASMMGMSMGLLQGMNNLNTSRRTEQNPMHAILRNRPSIVRAKEEATTSSVVANSLQSSPLSTRSRNASKHSVYEELIPFNSTTITTTICNISSDTLSSADDQGQDITMLLPVHKRTSLQDLETGSFKACYSPAYEKSQSLWGQNGGPISLETSEQPDTFASHYEQRSDQVLDNPELFTRGLVFYGPNDADSSRSILPSIKVDFCLDDSDALISSTQPSKYGNQGEANPLV